MVLRYPVLEGKHWLLQATLLLQVNTVGQRMRLRIVPIDHDVKEARDPVNEHEHREDQLDDSDPGLGLGAESHVLYQSLKTQQSQRFQER